MITFSPCLFLLWISVMSPSSDPGIVGLVIKPRAFCRLAKCSGTAQQSIPDALKNEDSNHTWFATSQWPSLYLLSSINTSPRKVTSQRPGIGTPAHLFLGATVQPKMLWWDESVEEDHGGPKDPEPWPGNAIFRPISGLASECKGFGFRWTVFHTHLDSYKFQVDERI